MARLYHAGCEASGEGTIDGTGTGSLSGRSRDTTTFRSGAASYKYDSGGTNVACGNNRTTTYVDGTTYYARGYFNAASAPSAAASILTFGAQTSGPTARLRTDGGVELLAGGVAQGSASASITDGTWHRVEVKAVAAATGNWSAGELWVDGTSIATWSGTQTRLGSTFMNWGWLDQPGANKVINVDDVALNDSTGVTNNSWPGDGKVVLLVPTADSAVGTGWTGGAGGVSSIFDAVNNTPPVGVADPGTNASQIRNATSNANVNYDATMTTYTAAGVGASATVNAVIPWVVTGAPSGTSPKQGTVGVVSNPTIANVALGGSVTPGAFWESSAVGTYPTNWKWSQGSTANVPSVTLGTAPVMRITQVTASTRIAMVCAMFIYVDYTPAAAAAVASLLPAPMPNPALYRM